MIRASVAYTDEVVEKELKLDERLDAMIERTIKRLAQTKAFKPMLGLTGTERTPARSASGKVLKLPVRQSQDVICRVENRPRQVRRFQTQSADAVLVPRWNNSAGGLPS